MLALIPIKAFENFDSIDIDFSDTHECSSSEFFEVLQTIILKSCTIVKSIKIDLRFFIS